MNKNLNKDLPQTSSVVYIHMYSYDQRAQYKRGLKLTKGKKGESFSAESEGGIGHGRIIICEAAT